MKIRRGIIAKEKRLMGRQEDDEREHEQSSFCVCAHVHTCSEIVKKIKINIFVLFKISNTIEDCEKSIGNIQK